MIILTTKRGRIVKLWTPAEWYERAYGEHGRGGGMIAFDAMVSQSSTYKVCIDCLTQDNLVECPNNGFLPTDGLHSKDYFMCQECLDYYNNKKYRQ